MPAGVATFASLCAGGALFISEASSLRALTVAAAAAAVTGAVLLRAWDRQASRRVGEVRAERANTELLAQERAAELEADVRETRVMRAKLEKRLRANRGQLARLRTEHATLLRRYANAETQRASALEGTRQLAIAAAEPVKALTVGAADHRRASGAPTRLTYLQADEALTNLRRAAARQRATEERAEQPAHEGLSQPGEQSPPLVPAPPQGVGGGGERTSSAGFSFFGTERTQPAADDARSAPVASNGRTASTSSAPEQPVEDAPDRTRDAPTDAGSVRTGEVREERPAAETSRRPTTRRSRQVAGKVIDLAD